MTLSGGSRLSVRDLAPLGAGGWGTGKSEVYVQAFPRGEARWKVSTEGGSFPAWRGDEIFYLSEGKMMVSRVKVGSEERRSVCRWSCFARRDSSSTEKAAHTL